MNAQVERLQEVSQTLESSGFSRQQSDAVIKSVALAMQTFAVTPDVLDRRIDKVMDAIKEQGEDIKDLNKSIVRLERTVMESNRKTLRYSMGFSLALFGAVATLIAMK